MFIQISDFAGVDVGAPTPSIMVPVGDYNLIVHDLGRGALPASPSGFTLVDITDDLKRGVAVAQERLTKLVSGVDVTRASELLNAANAMHLSGQQRLVAIAAKKGANASVKFAGKELSIAARQTRTVKLSMLYYRYTGAEQKDRWNKMGGALDSKTHADNSVAAANKYFRPQANVVFDLKSAKNWDSDGWMDSHRGGPPAEIPNINIRGGKIVAKGLVEKGLIDKSVDLTVIVVPQLYETDAVHMDPTNDYPSVIFTPWIFKDRPKTDPKADLFVPELCHEMVHGLGKAGHSSRAKVMCNDHANSTLDQELLIDKVTLDQINPLPR
jgi:hypothetical protein